MNATAILLAAGESTRMGRLKQLLPWDGLTLIEWQVRQLRAAGADSVIVVVGHAAADIAPAVPAGLATVVENAAYREGRASSLRTGAGAVPPDTRVIVILSVDQPRPAWATRRLLEAWQATSPAVAVPSYAGHLGHPVAIAASLTDELLAATEETLGLRAVLQAHNDDTLQVDFPAVPFDIDLNTPEDYVKALASFSEKRWAIP